MSDRRAPSPVDRRIGLNIRAARLAFGMSQERLAELVDLTFQQIQKYEKGINRVAASRLVAIADALAVPLMQLYDGVVTARIGAADNELAEMLASPEGLLLARLARRITPNANLRRKFIALCQALVESEPPAEPDAPTEGRLI